MLLKAGRQALDLKCQDVVIVLSVCFVMFNQYNFQPNSHEGLAKQKILHTPVGWLSGPK
jgi:hypothetical protein